MDTINERSEKLFELLPSGQGKAHIIKKRRLLVGRSQACDIVIPNADVTAIHAVIEVNQNGFKVFDMNSKNGTFVNGEKVIAGDFKVGDTIKFATQEFIAKEFDKSDVPTPPLNMLDPSLPPKLETKKVLPKASPEFEGTSVIPEGLPRVQYPLSKDPKAEFSEYIFEDSDVLYPIFHYGVIKAAVEVIILFKDRVYSVDYIPLKNGIYNLVGNRPGSTEIEYAYLGKKEKVPFVTIQNDEVLIQPLDGYELFSLNDHEKRNSTGLISLSSDDIFRFKNEDLQIFVRGTEAPPVVDHAPILRRDDDFKKYLLLMFILVFSFMGTMQIINVDKEIEQEKIPERIATILYKKKLLVKKSIAITETKKEPEKLVQKAPRQKVEPKKPTTDVNKPKPAKDVQVADGKTGTPTEKKVGKVKKVEPNKGPRTVKKTTVRPGAQKAPGKQVSNTAAPKTASNVRNKNGVVDTYKSVDFKNTMSSLLSKGGATKRLNTVATSESDVGLTALEEGERGATAVKAKVSKNVGSLVGAATGKLDSAKGVEGISNKRKTYTAGIPYKTVVLGGMDPDIIRKILEDHIPQFRFCYQSVLDDPSRKSAVSGIIDLNFLIGASGNVTKAGVESRSALPSSVKRCVVNVLRGIAFPEPMGGGVVEVNQPMNFYATSK